MKTRSAPRHFIQRRMSPHLRALLPALNAALLAGGAVCAHAADPPKPGVSTVLMTKDLTGIENKEGVMFTVQYSPGGQSLAHQHDAHVFVYVLEGSVKMQVDGEPVVTLTAGQTFYEKPGDIHRVSANASPNESAKILVFMVKDKGKPASRPLDAK
jgi:quercetin dioxygenase-like cupin family protein